MISFIITAREEPPEVLRRTVVNLCATTPPGEREIILVDDGTTEPVSGLPLEVSVVRNDSPIGVSRARRLGCGRASGEVFVCLDAHMTFRYDWLDRMLAHVSSGALLCSAFWSYDRATCHGFGADFVWCGERNHHAGRSPGFQVRHRVTYPGEGAVDVPMIIGACYMLSRSTYEALGGFSPIFRVWGTDEQDLSARAWMAGFGVKCVTEASVGHLWRGAFPYPVQFDHLEFNQLVLIRTVFDEPTIGLLERAFHPIPDRVHRWFDEVELADWRAFVQNRRRVADLDFLDRFVPELQRLRFAATV